MTMILSSHPGRGLLHIHDGGDNMRARSLRKNVVLILCAILFLSYVCSLPAIMLAGVRSDADDNTNDSNNTNNTTNITNTTNTTNDNNNNNNNNTNNNNNNVFFS